MPATSFTDGVTADSPVSLVLIDFELATATVLPGTRLTSWDYPQVTWNSSGEWLFFSNDDQLLAYRPGDDSAQRVAIDIDGPYNGMAAR